MFAKRGRRDKPEGGLFHARGTHGTDRTLDQLSVHTDSSRGTESKSVQGKHRRPVKKIYFEDTIKKMERSIDYQENQSRRCNLRFDGVSEVDGETREQTEKNIRRAMTTALEIPEVQKCTPSTSSARTKLAARGREPGLSPSSSNRTRTASWCYRRRRRIGLEASM